MTNRRLHGSLAVSSVDSVFDTLCLFFPSWFWYFHLDLGIKACTQGTVYCVRPIFYSNVLLLQIWFHLLEFYFHCNFFKVIRLVMHDCVISNDAADLIAEKINHLNELTLNRCKISEQVLRCISKSIQQRRYSVSFYFSVCLCECVWVRASACIKSMKICFVPTGVAIPKIWGVKKDFGEKCLILGE